jgi:hypothetical protein
MKKAEPMAFPAYRLGFKFRMVATSMDSRAIRFQGEDAMPLELFQGQNLGLKNSGLSAESYWFKSLEDRPVAIPISPMVILRRGYWPGTPVMVRLPGHD